MLRPASFAPQAILEASQAVTAGGSAKPGRGDEGGSGGLSPRVLEEYDAMLRSQNMVDFDDLIILTVRVCVRACVRTYVRACVRTCTQRAEWLRGPPASARALPVCVRLEDSFASGCCFFL